MIKMRTVFFVLISLLVLTVDGFSQKALLPQNQHQFVVIARGGDHTNAPENTLAAYQNAINDGADFIEIDLRTTKDNQLVILHNANLSDMTGYDKDVRDMLFDSLRKIKIRDPFYQEWGLHIIPTLQEVLQLCKGKINIYINFEDADVAQTFKTIFDAGMQEHVLIYIHEPHQFEAWGTMAPMMPLAMSLPEKIDTKVAMLSLLQTFNIDILNGNYTAFNAATITAAKETSVPVWADTLSLEEDAIQWNAAVGLGFNGLQTNHPKQLIDFLKAKGLR